MKKLCHGLDGFAIGVSIFVVLACALFNRGEIEENQLETRVELLDLEEAEEDPEDRSSESSESEHSSYLNYREWKQVDAKVTAYVPRTERHGKYNDGFTSIGEDAEVLDGVAVAPKAIPYRSLVYIPGVGLREADDTGSAMRRSWENGEYHIDLRVKDTKTALEWGVKHKTIYIKANE